MKLKALRLSNVGVFSEPVSVDGFSGSLDVLVGDNEFGKSTIFRALQAVFLKKYSGSSTGIKALASGGSGFPLIEADFEVESRLWRISKKFGRAGKAELRQVDKSARFSGDDAEVELRRLLGIDADSTPGQFDLLWVGQTKGLAAPEFDNGAAKSKKNTRGAPSKILEAIDSEVAQVATGPVARMVVARVEKALGELVTGRGARKHGRLANARQHLAGFEEQHAVAARTVRETEGLVAELAKIRAEGNALFDPRQRDDQDALLKGLRDQIADVRRLREREKTVVAQRDGARSRFLKAQADLEAFDQDLNALTRLHEGTSQYKAQLEKLREDLKVAAGDAQTVRARVDELRAREGRLVLAERRQDGLRKREQVQDLLATRRRGLKAAQETIARVERLGQTLREISAEDALYDRFIALEREIELLERQMDAALPTVYVAYEKGATAKIRQGKEPVKDKARISVREATTFTIDGVGALKVVPGLAEDRAAQEDQLAKFRSDATEILVRCGAEDAKGLRALRQERREVFGELAAAQARLDGLAPEGIATLETSVRELEGSLANFDGLPAEDETIGPDDDVLQLLAQVREALHEAEGEARARVADHDKLKSQVDTLAAKLGERVAQRLELEQSLGGADVRALKRENLARTVDEAKAALSSAEQTVSTLPKAEDAPEIGALEDQLARGEQEHKVSLRRGEEVQKKIAHLEGQIQRAAEGAAGLQLVWLEGEVARAQKDVEDVELDVDALRLLKETLDEAMARSREDVVAPVLQRLQPYLGGVFPGAEIVFGDNFKVEGLARSDGVETVSWLSDGTVEQLALIVRLAYARLLADAGTPMPFVLDDPLAYSDDARLVRTFECLRQAADVHQVIVLSCREQSFEALGGARLTVGPWDSGALN